jgi:hypothetical protein
MKQQLQAQIEWLRWKTESIVAHSTRRRRYKLIRHGATNI